MCQVFLNHGGPFQAAVLGAAETPESDSAVMSHDMQNVLPCLHVCLTVLNTKWSQHSQSDRPKLKLNERQTAACHATPKVGTTEEVAHDGRKRFVWTDAI